MLATTRYHLVLAVLLLAAVGAQRLLQPSHFMPVPPGSLDSLIPRTFGDWHAIDSGPVVVDPRNVRVDEEPNIHNPYDDILIRSYENVNGAVVQLVLAYGRQQRQEVKIHRPQLCYTAQGFRVLSVQAADFPVHGATNLPAGATQMLTRSHDRLEAVSYWVRVGSLYSDDAWAIRLHIFTQGLKGQVDDGVLVRVSQILTGEASASTASYALQGLFLSQLVASLPAQSRRLLIS
jgi:EpsI family protein